MTTRQRRLRRQRSHRIHFKKEPNAWMRLWMEEAHRGGAPYLYPTKWRFENDYVEFRP